MSTLIKWGGISQSHHRKPLIVTIVISRSFNPVVVNSDPSVGVSNGDVVEEGVIGCRVVIQLSEGGIGDGEFELLG